MSEYLQQGWGLAALLLLFLAALVFKSQVVGSYRRIIAQTGSDHPVEDRQLKRLEKQWEELAKLRGGVSRLKGFLDKFLRRYRKGGLYLRTWDRLASAMALLTIIGGVAMSSLCFLEQMDYRTVILYGAAGVVLGGAGILIGVLSDTQTLREKARTALEEYLDNKLYPQMKEYEAIPGEAAGREDTQERLDISLTEDEEKVLEEMLREYFA